MLVEDSSDPMFGAALRGVFIIDPKGVVRSVLVNDDHVGRNVDETLRQVKAFQVRPLSSSILVAVFLFLFVCFGFCAVVAIVCCLLLL